MTYRLLLADDEVHILRAAEYKLKRQDYEVICAHDGLEAWELLNEHTVDLVVTDLQMPRMNGIDLIKKMRSHPDLAAIPVLMLTAKGYELPRQELTDSLRVIEIMDKPFSPRELCARVQTALDSKRQGLASAVHT